MQMLQAANSSRVYHALHNWQGSRCHVTLCRMSVPNLGAVITVYQRQTCSLKNNCTKCSRFSLILRETAIVVEVDDVADEACILQGTPDR